MRILPAICVHMCSVSRVSAHSAAGGSGGQSSMPDTNSPGAIAGFDGGHGAAGGDVDHRDVVRQAVRGVERLLVAAQRDAPRPRAGGNGLQYAIGRCINLYYSVAAPRGGEDGPAVACDGDADGMIDRAQL